MLNTVIHLALLIVMPPLLLGVIGKTKAFFGGRVGMPLLQPYYDILKLLRKGMVISRATTWLFVAAPAVTLATVLLAGLMIPMGAASAPVSFAGNLILFAYLLALGRFFTATAALDTGSAFEGMGAAREVTFACLSEPAFFFALLALTRISGSLVLDEMLHAPLTSGWTLHAAPLTLVAIGLFILLLAENCRIPVDDPNTHLELTMIHEVMVLDHSGPLLGMILYGAAVKLFVLGAVLLHILAPFAFGNPWLDWLAFVAGMLALAVAVGIVESTMARLQMRHVPYLLVAAILLCGFAFILLVR